MNNQRRKKLGEAFDLVAKAEEIVNAVKDEEAESYENLPDSFRYGTKGDEMQDCIDMMDEVIGYLQDTNSVIEQI